MRACRSKLAALIYVAAISTFVTAVLVRCTVGNAADYSERMEAKFGTPTPIEAAHVGWIRGHTGKYTAWVAEYLTPDRFVGPAHRQGHSFLVDRSVGNEFRDDRDAWHKDGYANGHMAPAADFHFSQTGMRYCFLMSNMMPQTAELNEGCWADLEEHVRGLARLKATRGVWAFTGPAWLPDNDGRIELKTIGEQGTWVPTHCWKAVLYETLQGYGMRAWLLPNSKTPPKNFEDGRVCVNDIERFTGLDFFTLLDPAIERELEAAK